MKPKGQKVHQETLLQTLEHKSNTSRNITKGRGYMQCQVNICMNTVSSESMKLSRGRHQQLYKMLDGRWSGVYNDWQR